MNYDKMNEKSFRGNIKNDWVGDRERGGQMTRRSESDKERERES